MAICPVPMRQNGHHLRPTPVELVLTKWLPQGSAVHGHESSPHKSGCHLPVVRLCVPVYRLAAEGLLGMWSARSRENPTQGKEEDQICRAQMGRLRGCGGMCWLLLVGRDPCGMNHYL